MPAAEVLDIINWLTARDVTYQVNGGWGVDALVGHQTREHGDLDLFVDTGSVAELLEWLDSRDYRPVEDWLPVRIELASPHGRIDIHPMALDAHGNGLQQGFGTETFRHAAHERTTGHIAGTPVVVATRERLRQLREGYELRPQDIHDLALLDDCP